MAHESTDILGRAGGGLRRTPRRHHGPVGRVTSPTATWAGAPASSPASSARWAWPRRRRRHRDGEQPRVPAGGLGRAALGLYYAAVNWHLSTDEVAYILQDCGAQILITSQQLQDVVAQLSARESAVPRRPLRRWRAPRIHALAGRTRTPSTTHPSRTAAKGASSSTPPARPGGRRRSSALSPHPASWSRTTRARWPATAARTETSEDSVYLSPAPLYHSAPLMSCMTIHRIGATGGRDGALRRRGGAGADRAVPGHPQPARARPCSSGCCKLDPGRARALRPLEPAARHPRLRALPGRGQAPDDRVVGAHPPRVLRRHRGHGHDHHRLARSGWPIPARSAAPAAARSTSSATTATSCRPGETGRRLLRERPHVRVPRTTRPRRASIQEPHGWRTLGDVGHVDDGRLPLPHRPGGRS